MVVVEEDDGEREEHRDEADEGEHVRPHDAAHQALPAVGRHQLLRLAVRKKPDGERQVQQRDEPDLDNRKQHFI